MLRDPAVAYTLPDGTQELRVPYWKSEFNTPQDAVSRIPFCSVDDKHSG